MEYCNFENVAITFIEEKIAQLQLKQLKPEQHAPAIGHQTESSFRESLNEYFNKYGLSFSPYQIKSELVLTADQFIDAGVNDSKIFVRGLTRSWRKCDLCAKVDNRIVLLGEFSTTTAVAKNYCSLINKNLTAIRTFGISPLTIVFYPDTKPETLSRNHRKVLEGLWASDHINKAEYNILEECFFILTNLSWENGLKKRMKSLMQLDVTLQAKELLHDDDINKDECKRLTDYLSKVVKEGSK